MSPQPRCGVNLRDRAGRRREENVKVLQLQPVTKASAALIELQTISEQPRTLMFENKGYPETCSCSLRVACGSRRGLGAAEGNGLFHAEAKQCARLHSLHYGYMHDGTFHGLTQSDRTYSASPVMFSWV